MTYGIRHKMSLTIAIWVSKEPYESDKCSYEQIFKTFCLEKNITIKQIQFFYYKNQTLIQTTLDKYQLLEKLISTLQNWKSQILQFYINDYNIDKT